MTRLLTNRWFSVALMLATLLSFALQPWGYYTYRSGNLALPTLVLGSLSAALLAARAFVGKPWMASAVTILGLGAFGWGESYMDAGLNVLIVGPMAWWSESVAGMLVIMVVPACIVAAILANVWARVLAKVSL